jgi:hypothetical protein
MMGPPVVWGAPVMQGGRLCQPECLAALEAKEAGEELWKGAQSLVEAGMAWSRAVVKASRRVLWA